MIVLIILGVAFMCGIGIAVVDAMRNHEPGAPTAPRRGRAYFDEWSPANPAPGETFMRSRKLPPGAVQSPPDSRTWREFTLPERVGDVAEGEIAEDSTDLPLSRGRTLAAGRVIDYFRRLGAGS